MNNTTPVKPAAPAVGSIVHRKKTVGKVTANPFCSIVERTGGAAGINRNFFASYSDFKITVGYVMEDGQLPYGTSGLSSLGITADGRVRMDSPALFTASRLRTPPDRQ